MNWFERYGIVGMFFVIMTGVWYSLLFPYNLQQINESSQFFKLILGIGGVVILPCGYLITIFQKQMFYRRWPRFIKNLLPPQIHKGMWEKMTDAGKKHIKDAEDILDRNRNIPDENIFSKSIKEIKEDESKLEYILAFYYRINNSRIDKESIADFIRKRFDVISINHGFIWVVVLSPFVAIFLELFQLSPIDLSSSWFKSYSLFLEHFLFFGLIKVSLLLLFSFSIIFILKCSINTFADQMIEVFARKMS